MKPLIYNFKGVKSCGCAVAMIVDDGDDFEIGDIVLDMLRGGLIVSRCKISDTTISICKCEASNALRHVGDLSEERK